MPKQPVDRRTAAAKPVAKPLTKAVAKPAAKPKVEAKPLAKMGPPDVFDKFKKPIPPPPKGYKRNRTVDACVPKKTRDGGTNVWDFEDCEN